MTKGGTSKRTAMAALGTTLFLGLIFLTVWSVAFWFTSATDTTDCACGAQIALWQQHLGLSGVGLLATLGLACLTAWIISAALLSGRKTQSMLKALEIIATPAELRQIWNSLSPKLTQLVVFTDEAPQAFCAGIIQPQVYCSSALVEQMNPTQLSAIFSHELVHAHNFDPFVQLVFTSLTSFFPFRWRAMIRGALVQHMECETDHLAAELVGRGVLGQALLEVANWEPVLPGVVAAGMASLVEQRLQVLAGWKPVPAFPWKSILPVLSSVAGVLLFGILFFGRIQAVFAQEEVLACQEETTLIINHEPYVLCPFENNDSVIVSWSSEL